MGTEKRERQKANRQLRLQEIAKEQQKHQTKRRALRIGLLVGGAVALTAVLYFTNRGSKSEDQSAATTIAAAVDPSATTPQISVDTAISTDPSATVDPSASTLPTDTTPIDTTPATAPTREPFVYGKGECAAADGSSTKSQKFDDAPKLCIDPTKKYQVDVETNMGKFTAVLDPSIAPGTVNNFVTLAGYHYFDETTCHRAIPGFVVQCGDPTATGSGGPGYSFADELPAAGAYEVGSLAMANSGADTNGSQFFIITGASGAALPPNYSLFGQVTDGLDTTVKDLDAAGNPADNGVPPLKEIKIVKLTVAEV